MKKAIVQFLSKEGILIPTSSIFLATSLAYGDGIENYLTACAFLLIAFLTAQLIYPLKLEHTQIGLFVHFILWGPIFIVGCYYGQTQEINLAIFLIAMGFGSIVTFRMMFDFLEYQTRSSDKAINASSIQMCALFLLFLSILCPIYTYYIIEDHKLILCVGVTLFFSIKSILDLFRLEERGAIIPKPQINALILLYTFLLSIGWIL